MLALLALLSAMLLPGLAVAADDPPLPRPRPDHDAQPGPPPVQPGQETDQQKLIREGYPGGDDSDALMPPADTRQARHHAAAGNAHRRGHRKGRADQ